MRHQQTRRQAVGSKARTQTVAPLTGLRACGVFYNGLLALRRKLLLNPNALRRHVKNKLLPPF